MKTYHLFCADGTELLAQAQVGPGDRDPQVLTADSGRCFALQGGRYVEVTVVRAVVTGQREG